ncbi:MAG: DinB family protein [Gemmatimonadales bacterium]
MFNSRASRFSGGAQVQGYVAELRHSIDEATPRLQRMTEEQARRSPKPGKWSPSEIIGHLIDSASNNHQRFVRARFQDDLVFPGYEQDAWVNTQKTGTPRGTSSSHYGRAISNRRRSTTSWTIMSGT